MTMESMDDLFLHGLQDIYFAEKHILKALPGMVKSVETDQLKRALEHHRVETQEHVRRLDQVFKMIGAKPAGVECKAMLGILDEAEEQMSEIEDGSVCDAAIIASAQTVEHYEITRYGTLAAWAKELGHTDAAGLLSKTLEEEKAADRSLTKLAAEMVNRAAA